MYESLFIMLSNGSLEFIDRTILRLVSVVTETITIFGTIYIIWYGYQLWVGRVQEPLELGVRKITKFIILLGLLSTTSLYIDVIVKMFWDSPDYLATLITGKEGSVTSSTKFLDKVRDDVFLLANKLADTGGFRNPKPIFTALLMEVTISLTTAYAFFLYALSKILLAILLSIGTIFICFYLFDSTQKFFEAWFNQVMNYMILYMLISAILMLLSAVIERSITGALASQSISLADIIQPIVFIIITWLVMMQMTSVAASLGGGVALSTMGAGAMAMKMFNKITGKAAKSTGKATWWGAKKTGKGAASRANKVYRGARLNRIKKMRSARQNK